LKSKVKELALIFFIFIAQKIVKKGIKEKNVQKSFGNRYTAIRALDWC